MQSYRYVTSVLRRKNEKGHTRTPKSVLYVASSIASGLTGVPSALGSLVDRPSSREVTHPTGNQSSDWLEPNRAILSDNVTSRANNLKPRYALEKMGSRGHRPTSCRPMMPRAQAIGSSFFFRTTVVVHISGRNEGWVLVRPFYLGLHFTFVELTSTH